MSENKKAKCIMVQGTMSGTVPHFRAGRSAHRTVQKSKYGAEQLRYP